MLYDILEKRIIDVTVDEFADVVAEKMALRFAKLHEQKDEFVTGIKAASKELGMTERTLRKFSYDKRFVSAFKREARIIRVNLTEFNRVYGEKRGGRKY